MLMRYINYQIFLSFVIGKNINIKLYLKIYEIAIIK